MALAINHSKKINEKIIIIKAINTSAQKKVLYFELETAACSNVSWCTMEVTNVWWVLTLWLHARWGATDKEARHFFSVFTSRATPLNWIELNWTELNGSHAGSWMLGWGAAENEQGFKSKRDFPVAAVTSCHSLPVELPEPALGGKWSPWCSKNWRRSAVTAF